MVKCEKFKLQNGLSASIVGLEDPSAMRIIKAFRDLHFVNYPAYLREWLVLTIWVGSEKVHLVCHFPRRNARTNALIIKQRLIHKYWEIVRDASFIVYKNTLYAVNEANSAVFEYVLQHKVSPKIAILIVPDQANLKM
jgi:hypothetical protein